MSAVQAMTVQEALLSELAELQEREGQLALQVVNGDPPKARGEWKKATARIAEIQGELHLIELAQQEAARRATAAQVAREAEERQAKEAKLVELREAKTAAFDRLREQVQQLVRPVIEAREAAIAVYALASELGLPAKWDGTTAVENIIATALGPPTEWRLKYIMPAHRDGAVVSEAKQLCASCGGEYPDTPSTKHNCSITTCDKCKAQYDKNADHKCNLDVVIHNMSLQRGMPDAMRDPSELASWSGE